MARCGPSPAAERPDFMAMIGLRLATLGAIRANLRGLPKLFQVQDDDICTGVIGPVGQQIIAGYIRTVADGEKGGDTHMARADVIQDRQAERATL